MKKIFTLFIFSSIALSASAQDRKNIVQAGVGINQAMEPVYYSPWTPHQLLPVLNFTYERLLPIKAGPGFFGIGVTGSYRAVKDDMEMYDIDGRELNRFVRYKTGAVALRTAYHLHPSILRTEKLDLYGALLIGARFRSTKYDGNNTYYDLGYNSKESDFYIGGVAGIRYFFFKGLGFYGEFGYDVTWFKTGMALRF